MSPSDKFVNELKRRRFLRYVGATGAAGLAGCVGQEDLQDGDGGDGGDVGTAETAHDDEHTEEAKKEPVDVGVVIPFSGDLSDFGGPMMNALRMAQEDINAAGGPLGRELVLHDEDSGTDATQGVNAANKLVDTNGVTGLVGAVSSGVTISIANSVTVPKEVLHITSASSSPTISTLDDNDLVFRTRTNDRFVAKVMAQIIEDEGADSAAVIFINNDFGEALADTFTSSFSGTTTAKVGYDSGQSSYQQVLAKAFEDNPDFIAFAGYPESGTTILSQWAEQGYGGNWVLHTSLLSNDVIDNVGADIMNGMYGVRTQPPSGGDTEHFVNDYESAYPDSQLFDPYSWNSYDALTSYALAVHEAGTTDANEVKNHMRGVSNPEGTAIGYGGFGDGVSAIDAGGAIDYSGPSGNVNYDDNGDVASDMVVVEVIDGAFENTVVVPANELV